MCRVKFQYQNAKSYIHTVAFHNYLHVDIKDKMKTFDYFDLTFNFQCVAAEFALHSLLQKVNFGNFGIYIDI